MPSSWGYCKHNGPEHWADEFPLANGVRQSPIDIRTDRCLHEEGGEDKLLFCHSKAKCVDIINTGAGWKVECDGDQTYLLGGPLKSKYRLIQFHCHWGKDDTYGSEHTVEGNSYPSEIHLVHWNCEKYESFSEAATKEDGLAVLGIFLTLGEEHSELKKIVSLFSKIKHLEETTKISEDIDISKFIPENKSYWTYPGSLTTPPCLESVTWIVFQDPVQISKAQLAAFRDLLSYANSEDIPEDEFEGKILENYRPPADVGNRTVRYIKCSE